MITQLKFINTLQLLFFIVIVNGSSLEKKTIENKYVNFNSFEKTTSLEEECGGVFFDSGGSNGNYLDNENITTTICPENSGDIVTLTFSSFEIENNFDLLKIYDGSSASSPLIGIFTGNDSPGIIIANITNGGCLTVVFTSDDGITREGWEASVTCGPAPTCVVPSEFIVDAVSEDSVTLYWSEVNDPGATEWEVEYGIAGFSQGSGTTITTVTSLPTITGLSAGQDYDVYVRSVCAEDDFSAWAFLTFSTTDLPPVCGGTFYDSGGVDGDYSNNENTQTTICSEVDGEIVTVNFSSFDVHPYNDILIVYDGPSITSPLLGQFTGLESPGSITGSAVNGGCLTFVFISDDYFTWSGWEASVTCAPPPTCIVPSELIVDAVSEDSVTLYWSEVNDPEATEWEVEYGIAGFTQGSGTTITTVTNFPTITGLSAGQGYDVYIRSVCTEGDFSAWAFLTFSTTNLPPVCGGMFYDSGGSDGDYSNNEDTQTTICPEVDGEVVIVNFSSFNIENGYDKMWIYDGASTSSPQIGVYSGTTSPEIVSGSVVNGGCLTFVFISDTIEIGSGWEASIICSVPPTCLTPTGFLIDGFTDNSVALYWDEVNSPAATTWEIEYGNVGFTQGSGTIVTATSNFTTVTGLSSGTNYDVYVRSICTEEDASIWTSKLSFETSGIAGINDLTLDTFIVYPNPATNLVIIKFMEFQEKVDIKIFTLQGQEVYSKGNVDKNLEVDVSHLTNGVYFINVRNDKYSFTKKFIKQ